MEKFQENLENAKQYFKTAEHMTYVSMQILKDNKLLIKILDEMHKSLIFMIKSLLQYEHTKGLYLYKNSELNFNIFKQKIAPKYLKQQDITNIQEILDLKQAHTISLSEFVKNDKFVLFLGDSYEVITLERIKSFLISLKKLIFIPNLSWFISAQLFD